MLVHQVREEAVHGLPRAADHPGQLRLGIRPGQADAAVRRGPEPRRFPQDPSREATGQIQEVEVLDVGRDRSNLARERREEGDPK